MLNDVNNANGAKSSTITNLLAANESVHAAYKLKISELEKKVLEGGQIRKENEQLSAQVRRKEYLLENMQAKHDAEMKNAIKANEKNDEIYQQRYQKQDEQWQIRCGEMRAEIQNYYLAEKKAMVEQLDELTATVSQFEQQKIDYETRIEALVITNEKTIEKTKVVMRERNELKIRLDSIDGNGGMHGQAEMVKKHGELAQMVAQLTQCNVDYEARLDELKAAHQNLFTENKALKDRLASIDPNNRTTEEQTPLIATLKEQNRRLLQELEMKDDRIFNLTVENTKLNSILQVRVRSVEMDHNYA